VPVRWVAGDEVYGNDPQLTCPPPPATLKDTAGC
jgi:hypothetical protein